MIQLTEAVAGRLYINSQPYQRGLLQVRYSIGGKVAIRDPFGYVLSNVPYSDFANPVTGLPFSSLVTLKEFIDANFFRVPAGLRLSFPYLLPLTLS